MEIDVGQIVDRKYELRRLLGEGGMGQVWIARHRSLAQDVALKLLLPPRDSHEDARVTRRRFLLEAQVAASLSRKSRNIVQVTDHGEDRGMVYLVMDLLQGSSLDGCLDTLGHLDPPTTSAVVGQIARGLGVAHAEGVLHRDLKPGNVFLAQDEEGHLLVKILDFGIAGIRDVRGSVPRVSSRLTAKGLVLGSPSYMSPEQALAQPLDARADVWSLAVVAYEMLAGVPPFAGPTQEDTILRVVNHRAAPLGEHAPELGDAFDAFFARAFARSIDERFGSAQELARAFAAIAPPAEVPRVRVSVAPPPVTGPGQATAGEPAVTQAPEPQAAPAPREDTGAPSVPLRSPSTGVLLGVAAVLVLIAVGAFGVHAMGDQPAAPPTTPPSATAPSAAAPSAAETTTPTQARTAPPPPHPAASAVPSLRPQDLPPARGTTAPPPRNRPAPPPGASAPHAAAAPTAASSAVPAPGDTIDKSNVF